MVQSDVTRRQLDILNRVPGLAIEEHVAIPQLVVCGNPSVGKTSVLESVTGIPLWSEGTTRFTIELSLRHVNCDQVITASIIPHYSRDEATASSLRRWSRVLSDYSGLPDVIEEVATLLQLRGYSEDGSALMYAPDIMRIEVAGDTGVHLKIVDTPALISREDVEVRAAKEVLDSYLGNPLSTILAVIPADRDIEVEHTVQLCGRHDPLRERTVGIVTKPDLIPDEASALKLAQLLRNKGPEKLALGYFVLQNYSSEGLARRPSTLGRSESELTYAQNSFWSKIQHDPTRTGAPALQTFLKSRFEDHFNRELPKLTLKIMQQLHNTRQQYEEMGPGRDTIRDQRLFLSKLSMNFSQFVHSALHGMYWDIEFFSDNVTPSNRLREQIRRLNSDFLNYMLEKSQTVKVRTPNEDKKKSKSSADGTPRHPSPTTSAASSTASVLTQSVSNSLAGAGAGASHLTALGEPRMVTHPEYNDWLLGVYRKAKKTSELRGNQPHEIVPEMFRAQSGRWRVIAEQHVKVAHKLVSDFVNRVLDCVIKEDTVRAEIHHLINPGLHQNLTAALEELGKVLDDDKVQPVTYEFFVNEHVRQAKQLSVRVAFKQALASTGRVTYDPSSEERAMAIASMQPEFKNEWDDRVAVGSLVQGLHDYYKASTNTFVDNICRQVIERHIVQKMGDVFNIDKVLHLSDDDVERIAGEAQERRERKSSLMGFETVLARALDDLHT